jgi:uncharacterized membrane protein YjjP (DUF1212 family)
LLLARNYQGVPDRMRLGWPGHGRRRGAAGRLEGQQAPGAEVQAEAEAIDQSDVALHLAMRVGDLLLSAGLSVDEVLATMKRITRAYGLGEVHVDVKYNAISASHRRARDSLPVGYTRVMQPRETDYSQVGHLFLLSKQIQLGLPLAEAVRAYERIRSAKHPYQAWITQVARAGVAAAAVLRFSLAWQVIAVTFVVSWAVDRMLAWLRHRGLPAFFRQVAGAVVITLVAAVLSTAASPRWFFGNLDGRSSLLVVGGIIMLIADTENMMVATAQDAIDEYYVTASARIIQVTMRISGILVGLVAGIWLTTALNMPLHLAAAPFHRGAFVAQLVGAGITGAFFVVGAYADLATTLLAGAVGCFGWVVYTGSIHFGVNGDIAARSLTALVIAVVATLFTFNSRVPGFAVVNAAVLALVPGLVLYSGLLDFVGTPARPRTAAGAALLLTGLGITLGIAAGATLGTYLGRLILPYVRRSGTHSARR